MIIDMQSRGKKKAETSQAQGESLPEDKAYSFPMSEPELRALRRRFHTLRNEMEWLNPQNSFENPRYEATREILWRIVAINEHNDAALRAQATALTCEVSVVAANISSRKETRGEAGRLRAV